MSGARGTAVVTDGLWRKSLSAIRSLGRAGYDVVVLGDSRLTVGFWSRYARRACRGPLASQDPAGFRAHLAEVLARCGDQPVLLPMEDATLLAVCEERARFAELARFLLPDDTALQVAMSKAATMERARALGIPCPRAVTAESADALLAAARDLPHDELVVKPLRGSGSQGVRYLARAELTAELLRAAWQQHGPLLVQERIPRAGTAIGASLVMDARGEPIACLCHRRLREYPTTGGPSTDRVTVHHARIAELSEQLLRDLGWRGVAMLEWKVDPRSGTPLLLEINPRFWGSLALGPRAGVDFPVLYADAARGAEVAPVEGYRDGVRCRWAVGEVLRWLSDGAREPVTVFTRGFVLDSEEWDALDVRGFCASFVCNGLLALRPSYWRYLRRR